MSDTAPDTVTFAPGNTFAYGQDFGFHRSIPAGVLFTVEDRFTVKDRGPWCRLTAPGYGVTGDYGNGALYVAAVVVRAARAEAGEAERVADWEDCA